jgi:thiamine pyrophosphate-dependent acetolactate synthase large subunit-like protein
MPVVDVGGRFNFPTSHPLDATDAALALGEPDVVLALDVVDLAGALGRLSAGGRGGGVGPRVVHVTTRELGIRSLVSHYQKLPAADLTITAAAGPSIAALLAACRSLAVPDGASARFARSEALGIERRRVWALEAEAVRDERPIAVAWLFHELAEALRGRPWSLVNAPIESPWPRRLLDIERPEQYLGGSGGAGIGYAAGASVGAALALRDRGVLPVDVQGDGELLYTPGAIWTAVHEGIPLLMVIADNRSYYNSERHQIWVAEHRGRPLDRAAVGTRIVDPEVDHAALARSMGAKGYGPVTDPASLGAVLRDAIADVAAGSVALVDVECQSR